MFALEIRFLTGRYAAGRYDDPAAAEWPPHPARVYSALTAALYDDPEPSDEARSALEWLAGAGPPEVLASDASERHLGDVYVPVNDVKTLGSIDLYLDRLAAAEADAEALEGKAATKAARQVEKTREKLKERSAATAAVGGRETPESAVEVLERRPRHPRRFPVALPDLDTVHLLWPQGTPPADVKSVLDELCGRVSRLGHSSSLVSMRLLDGEVELQDRSRWVPDPAGEHFLRTPRPNQLDLLDEAHERYRQTEPRVLPANSVRYMQRRGDGTPVVLPHSDFSSQTAEWLMYEVVRSPDGERRTLLDLSLAQQVARAARGTLLSALDPDAPETLTGHDRKGRPTSDPHLAFVPLADVGHPHASGSILGLAMVPPHDLPVGDRDVLLEAIFQAERAVADSTGAGSDLGSGRRLRLTLGRHGVVHLRRLTEPSDRKTLTTERWCRPSRRWASASAVALGRNPGNLRSPDPEVAREATEAAEVTVADACAFAGLPAPASVWIHKRSLLAGAASAKRFMPFPEGGGGPRRVCVHTEIVFPEPVAGPVLIGAGRFFGLGLHLPVDRSWTGGGS